MYCNNCGSKISGGNKFCTECGHPTLETKEPDIHFSDVPVNQNEKWWQRLSKVIYIVLYIPLLIIIPAVWMGFKSSYTGYYLGQYHYEDTYGKAFWYSLLTLVIYLIILRLIKFTFQYIVYGKKPTWKKEFKKLF